MQVAGLSLTQDSFKNTWEGVIRTLSKEDFATAFRRWYKQCEKCVKIGGNYVEKS
jgi:hypothetical protein